MVFPSHRASPIILSPYFQTFMEPMNRFRGMNSASLAGRYDNPIPTWFLASIDFLKIPALDSQTCFIFRL
jgi:hypothetical protein